MKILIADDSVLSRTLLERTLSSFGWQVESVRDGRAAAELLCRADGPRMALLDWMMPELDGPAVCLEVRAKRHSPYVYMILLTSRESKADIVKGLESGADDYLTKPFHPEELKARLRTGQRILSLEDCLLEAQEELLFKATHDPLTGLWNRGMIVDLLKRELSRSSREHTCTAVLLADLDHFKHINDNYGHLVGDEVLCETGRRLRTAVRPYDHVGRYGGEEFFVVLNNCNPGAALARAEQIRRIVSDTVFVTSAGKLRVSMSLGVIRSVDWDDPSFEELLREVDKALYQAKTEGRNCVRLALRPGAAELPHPKSGDERAPSPQNDRTNRVERPQSRRARKEHVR